MGSAHIGVVRAILAVRFVSAFRAFKWRVGFPFEHAAAAGICSRTRVVICSEVGRGDACLHSRLRLARVADESPCCTLGPSFTITLVRKRSRLFRSRMHPPRSQRAQRRSGSGLCSARGLLRPEIYQRHILPHRSIEAPLTILQNFHQTDRLAQHPRSLCSGGRLGVSLLWCNNSL
jgi:hypothetical protein